jgi:hypothetical protein
VPEGEGDTAQPGAAQRRLSRRQRAPQIDETLYDL